MRRSPILALCALSLLASCSGELEHNGNLELRLSLERGSVALLSSHLVGDLPNAPVDGEALTFHFRADDGSTETRGAVRDARVLRTEFDRAGMPDPIEVVSDVGVVDVRVPATAGVLTLYAGEELLGAVSVDPDQRVARAPLMRQEDVLGAPVKVVDGGDPASSVDILFLPEGFQEGDLAGFHATVDGVVDVLSQRAGYREYWSGFNVWRQDVRSRTQGNGSGGQALDTAFETATGVGGVSRCNFFANADGLQAAKDLGERVGADAVVVVVNSWRGTGCAKDGVVVTPNSRGIADTVAHELGHALFGLADEYETPMASGFCSIGPNVWFRADTSVPWADMLTTSELPTPPSASFGTIGAFEGGGYCARHRWRPTHNCMMRSNAVGMCKVCRREVERTLALLAPEAGPVDTSGDRVVVTNRTGAGLWVRCAGAASPTCSDWTHLYDGDAAEVLSRQRELVLQHTEANPPVAFNFMRVSAPGPEVSVYANRDDPFSNTPAQPPEVTLDAPASLSPRADALLESADATLTWGSAEGAENYTVVVERGDGASWAPHAQATTHLTQASVALGEVTASYRWWVTGCKGATCQRSETATFRYAPPAPVAPPATIPEAPTGLEPAHHSAAPAGAVTLSWGGVGGARYDVDVLGVDPATGGWIAHDSASAITGTSHTVTLPEANVWWAWSVRACSEAGCSPWQEYSLLLTN
jgi:hypothetical protein